MRFDRKGMVAVMDAMFFIIILGIAVSAMFAYMPQEYEGPSAERIHNDLMRTELQMSDVFDVNDTRIVSIDRLIAAHLSSGEGDIEDYIFTVLRSMVPVTHEFMFVCSFNGNTVVLGDCERTASSYECETEVAGGVLYTSLTIS